MSEQQVEWLMEVSRRLEKAGDYQNSNTVEEAAETFKAALLRLDSAKQEIGEWQELEVLRNQEIAGLREKLGDTMIERDAARCRLDLAVKALGAIRDGIPGPTLHAVMTLQAISSGTAPVPNAPGQAEAAHSSVVERGAPEVAFCPTCMTNHAEGEHVGWPGDFP